MPKYAPNDVILGGAVAVALAQCVQDDPHGWADRLARSYRAYDDQDLAPLFLKWGEIIGAMIGEGQAEWRVGQLARLAKLIERCLPDGRKRPHKLFGGVWFVHEPTPAHAREGAIGSALASYCLQLHGLVPR